MAESAAKHEPTWSRTGPQRTFARHDASLRRLVRMALSQRPITHRWDAAIGLIHAGDPVAAAANGSRFAVTVATAMLPDATVDDAVANALRFTDDLGEMAGEFGGRLQGLVENAAKSADVFALREPFYREFLTKGSWRCDAGQRHLSQCQAIAAARSRRRGGQQSFSSA